MRSGSQSQRQHTCARVAEGGHGLSPVLLIEIGLAANTGHLGAVFAKPVAERAGDDLLVQNAERIRAEIRTGGHRKIVDLPIVANLGSEEHPPCDLQNSCCWPAISLKT